MIDKIRSLIDLMNDKTRKDVSAYKVWTQTGISQATLSDLKSGKKEISSLSINNGQKLVDFYDKLDK